MSSQLGALKKRKKNIADTPKTMKVIVSRRMTK